MVLVEIYRLCIRFFGFRVESLVSVIWLTGWIKEIWVRILVYVSGRVIGGQVFNLFVLGNKFRGYRDIEEL